MKMLFTKMSLLASVALAALLSAQVAHAQRYQAAPRSFDAGDHSRVTNQRSGEDQRIIDEITKNDESAGK